jgi:hypothetical protein
MMFVYQVVRAGFEPRRGVGFGETRVWDNEIGPQDLRIAHGDGDHPGRLKTGAAMYV